ncbi:MAG: preprotein translocase subunit YajC [Planctomycetes bacterium]|nr:preprotein translocase subunit YajC [Planctomycetota bacterium]
MDDFGKSIVSAVPLIAAFLVLMFLMTSNTRKEKKKKEELMSAMKKGDKIQSLGGIIGTIEEIRDEEVIVLVDARNKGTLTFHKSSISHIIA